MKSPLKDKPLRNPGQSVDQYLLDVVLDDGIKFIIIGTLCFLALILNWTFYFTKTPLPPYWFTLIVLIVIAYCYYKVIEALKKIGRIKQGRDGERAVGQYLDDMRNEGFTVLHDIPAKDFNIDHVIVAKSGVYVIETKTYSKPDKGSAKIVYTGDNLIFHNGKNDDKPLIQVKAASNWLMELIKESTGRNVEVNKVVLFPGWFIEPTAESKQSDIWVLNPKALPTFISNSRDQLTAENQKLISYHLKRYVRTN